MAQFIGEGEFEIEDLIPTSAIVQFIDRKYRCDQYFEDFYHQGEPIVNQIEIWAKQNKVSLEDGWKVELARSIHNRFEKIALNIEDAQKNIWIEVFRALTK